MKDAAPCRSSPPGERELRISRSWAMPFGRYALPVAPTSDHIRRQSEYEGQRTLTESSLLLLAEHERLAGHVWVAPEQCITQSSYLSSGGKFHLRLARGVLRTCLSRLPSGVLGREPFAPAPRAWLSVSFCFVLGLFSFLVVLLFLPFLGAVFLSFLWCLHLYWH